MSVFTLSLLFVVNIIIINIIYFYIYRTHKCGKHIMKSVVIHLKLQNLKQYFIFNYINIAETHYIHIIFSFSSNGKIKLHPNGLLKIYQWCTYFYAFYLLFKYNYYLLLRFHRSTLLLNRS